MKDISQIFFDIDSALAKANSKPSDANDSWTHKASGYTDRKAAYKLADDNKRIIANLMVANSADRIVVALTKNYKIRLIELNKSLSNTQKTILAKWAQIEGFENKAQVHQILWDSFIESITEWREDQ